MSDEDVNSSEKYTEKNEVNSIIDPVIKKFKELDNKITKLTELNDSNEIMGYLTEPSSHSCISCISMGSGENRILRIVKGESGSEVSKVVKVILKDIEKSGTINISNSTIGMLNTGEIENVQSISMNVSTLMDSGQKNTL